MARGSGLIPSSKRPILKGLLQGPGILTTRVPEPLSLIMLLLCTPSHNSSLLNTYSAPSICSSIPMKVDY